jgi:hypothetical protein
MGMCPIESRYRELAVGRKEQHWFDAAVEAVRITQASRDPACWTLIDITLISESADPARGTASRQRRVQVAHHHISAVQLLGPSEDKIVLYA